MKTILIFEILNEMKTVYCGLIIAVLLILFAASCGQNSAPFMTMTATGENDELRFVLNGSGTATVDWGDGSEKETAEISEYTDFIHGFSGTGARTVTVSGKEIIYFGCIWSGLTELDASRITALKELSLKVNRLTGLDLSKNTALTYVDVKANQFTAAALNDLFATLHPDGGTINIAFNPGTDDCDKSIAETKGWTVEVVEPEEEDN